MAGRRPDSQAGSCGPAGASSIGGVRQNGCRPRFRLRRVCGTSPAPDRLSTDRAATSTKRSGSWPPAKRPAFDARPPPPAPIARGVANIPNLRAGLRRKFKHRRRRALELAAVPIWRNAGYGVGILVNSTEPASDRNSRCATTRSGSHDRTRRARSCDGVMMANGAPLPRSLSLDREPRATPWRTAEEQLGETR